ncbi:MAG: hypothetical protein WC967_15550 [Balneolaceae bacterium]
MSYNVTIGNGDFVYLTDGLTNLPDGTGLVATVTDYGVHYTYITTDDGSFVAIPSSGGIGLPSGSFYITDIATDYAPPSGGSSAPYYFYLKKYTVKSVNVYTLETTTLTLGMGGLSFL